MTKACEKWKRLDEVVNDPSKFKHNDESIFTACSQLVPLPPEKKGNITCNFDAYFLLIQNVLIHLEKE